MSKWRMGIDGWNCILRLAITAAIVSLAPPSRAADQPHRPNIVLMVADDLGYAELGCYGQKIIHTPHLDQLARQGMCFTQFYAGAPVCAPSRCVLMTGKHSGHAAIRDNRKPKGKRFKGLSEKHGLEFPGQQPLPHNEVTIAELLKTRGYATASIGKWGLGHVGTSGDPNQQGFDLFYGYLCQIHAHNHYPRFLWRNNQKETLPGNTRGATGDTYSQDRFTEEALQFIRRHQDEPFFLYLPLIIPHLAIQVPDTSLAQYATKIEEAPHDDRSKYKKHPTPRAGYAAMISHMDAGIGRIVKLIDDLNLSQNTIILFTSDNGPTFDRLGGADSDYFNSTGPLRGRKGSLYEGGIRVPLIARWTGKIPASGQSNHLAAFWDLLPTLCELAGATPLPTQPSATSQSAVSGISFAPTLLARGEQAAHEYLYWEFPAYAHQQAVRAGNWKAIRSGLNEKDTDFELYDLSNDVGEQNNLAGRRPEVVERLADIAEKAHTASRIFPLFELEWQRGRPLRGSP